MAERNIYDDVNFRFERYARAKCPLGEECMMLYTTMTVTETPMESKKTEIAGRLNIHCYDGCGLEDVDVSDITDSALTDELLEAGARVEDIE